MDPRPAILARIEATPAAQRSDRQAELLADAQQRAAAETRQAEIDAAWAARTA